MISGRQEFFFLANWWAGYFFPFFSHKLSITFVLHAIFYMHPRSSIEDGGSTFKFRVEKYELVVRAHTNQCSPYVLKARRTAWLNTLEKLLPPCLKTII